MLSNDLHIHDEIKQSVSAIVLAGVALAEIIGPIFPAAVKSAKEDNKDRERLVEFLSEEFIKVDLKANDKWDAIKQLTFFMMKLIVSNI